MHSFRIYASTLNSTLPTLNGNKIHKIPNYYLICLKLYSNIYIFNFSGDLLPWVEYAEIGIHASDLTRVSWLQRGGPDNDGFVWERATKGHYYRVAYSATNRIYVLILPFNSRNGTMWPADWVLAYQRDFPERHLHPLAQVSKFCILAEPVNFLPLIFFENI